MSTEPRTQCPSCGASVMDPPGADGWQACRACGLESSPNYDPAGGWFHTVPPSATLRWSDASYERAQRAARGEMTAEDRKMWRLSHPKEEWLDEEES